MAKLIPIIPSEKGGYDYHKNDLAVVGGVGSFFKWVGIVITASICIAIVPHVAAGMFLAWCFWKVINK